MKKVILASTSPYRAQLLETLGISFEKMDSGVDEDFFKDQIKDPLELAKKLAFEKAQAIFLKDPNAIVIGGDQISLFEHSDRTGSASRVLGKPGDFEGALKQLTLLEGQTHKLITCVCVLAPNFQENFEDITTLQMRNLTQSEIVRYIEKDEPFNCAGSYKIESVGISLFEQVQTNDFTAIVGLPLIQLSKTLRKVGLELP